MRGTNWDFATLSGLCVRFQWPCSAEPGGVQNQRGAAVARRDRTRLTVGTNRTRSGRARGEELPLVEDHQHHAGR